MNRFLAKPWLHRMMQAHVLVVAVLLIVGSRPDLRLLSLSPCLPLRLHTYVDPKGTPVSLAFPSQATTTSIVLGFAKGSSPDLFCLRNKPSLLTDPCLLNSGEI
jgi:hypothetical protein